MTLSRAESENKKAISPPFAGVALALLSLLLVIYGDIAGEGVKRALKLCSESLIPTLLPLTALSEILTLTGTLEKISERLTRPLSKILRLPQAAVSPVLLGLIGGYTSSAHSAVLALDGGKITKEECEISIALSSMPSLAFLVGFAGAEVLGSARLGALLWLITLASSLVSGIILRSLAKKSNQGKPRDCTLAGLKRKRISRALTEAISNTAKSMLTVCTAVALFSALAEIAESALSHLGLSEKAIALIVGALEISRGIDGCSEIFPLGARLVACSALVGWSGICVHSQIMSLCEGTDIKFKNYFLLKILQAAISSVLALLIAIVLKI